MADTEQSDLTTLTVTLLSAYFSNNTVDSAQLAGLIQSTHTALRAIDAPAPAEIAEPEHAPAVSVRKSLASSEHLISLIDGKPYKMLKRHLGTHGLTPAEYRARYGLPANYPMVAKDYSDARRAVAEKLGLGRKIGNNNAADGVADAAPADPVTPAPVASPAKPGKPRKSAAKTAPAAPAAIAAKPTRPAKAPAAEGNAPAPAAPVDADPAPTATPPARKARAAAKPAVTTAAPKVKATAKPKTAKSRAPAGAASPVAETAPETPATPAPQPKTRGRKTLKIAAG